MTTVGITRGRATRSDAVLDAAQWRQCAEQHAERADALTAGWRARRARGESHAIEDFLFTYYPTKPGKLRIWHPGAGVVLRGAEERSGWRHYRATGEGVAVDAAGFLEAERTAVGWAEGILRGTRARPARFGCSGLHEWAMVYRQGPEELRHSGLPLRLGHEATDRVVESHDISCTHVDAFRFFTPEARPRNRFHPVRAEQPLMEQGGCLHANMDLYKWALRLGPIVPGALLLDAFALARDIRELDMRASPYDVSRYGLAPVPIETDEGKREYEALQRVFARRADALRQRLLLTIAAAREESLGYREEP